MTVCSFKAPNYLLILFNPGYVKLDLLPSLPDVQIKQIKPSWSVSQFVTLGAFSSVAVSSDGLSTDLTSVLNVCNVLMLSGR